jgi:uncharacterized SAM-binding protein YcdF (DUF218 family)
MNFIFNVLTVFLYPVVLLLVMLVVCAVFWRRGWARVLLLVAIVYLYASASGFLPELLVRPLEAQFQPVTHSAICAHKAMIVLGGGLSSTKMQTVPMSMAYARIVEAAQIYHQGLMCSVRYHIYVSGGDTQHRGVSEAAVYKKAWVALGVPAAAVSTENKSQNTYQNAEFLAKRLHPRKEKGVYVLVTSALHMSRAVQYFSHFGFKTLPAPSDYPAPMLRPVGFPFAYNLAIMEMAVHEYLGIARMTVLNAL